MSLNLKKIEPNPTQVYFNMAHSELALLQQVINQLSVQHEKRANIEIATFGFN